MKKIINIILISFFLLSLNFNPVQAGDITKTFIIPKGQDIDLVENIKINLSELSINGDTKQFRLTIKNEKLNLSENLTFNKGESKSTSKINIPINVKFIEGNEDGWGKFSISYSDSVQPIITTPTVPKPTEKIKPTISPEKIQSIEINDEEKKDVIETYKIDSEEEVRLFGIFKIKLNIKKEINTETGEIQKIKYPWWKFLTW